MKLRRGYSAALAFVMVMGAFMVLIPSPAMAAAQVGRVSIYDGASVFGTHQSKVSQAAQRLARLGPDVCVVTLADNGKSVLPVDYLQAASVRCASLSSHNLLIFALVKNRSAMMRVGDRWQSAIEKSGGVAAGWHQFFAITHRPGHIADDFVAGITAAGGAIKTNAHVSSKADRKPFIVLICVLVAVALLLAWSLIRRKTEKAKGHNPHVSAITPATI